MKLILFSMAAYIGFTYSAWGAFAFLAACAFIYELDNRIYENKG